ncbi:MULTISPECIES: ATP-dependent nuclease [Burkholderia cepacia complex]|uniref:AAA family ATPase n=1 Tax=Burkholderia orbicola TaxID=2978683 RepID=A0ABT8P1V6_9BURK|nr:MULTISPECIES: AAA family ATPase [Burkholderia cepacia complex]MBJ9729141.1 AAA family ATPase [Burkholderia cenocepacia]MDN7527754.1 AAA family ATPase [Burkholderia orbicola]
MKVIKKLILKNFKRYKTLEIEFDADLNILIGGNEAGKSSVLQALDLVMSASRSKVESIGLESLFNAACIEEFMRGKRQIENLPTMFVEAHLEGFTDHELNGKNHDKRDVATDGIRLICEPVEEYTEHIEEILKDPNSSFPFEYYAIRFLTFGGYPVHPYKKPLKHVLIDSSLINNEYATREYTRSMYLANASVLERNRHGLEYRNAKTKFRDDVLIDVNSKLPDYKFSVRSSPRASIETDIMITEGDIPIDSKGKGRQCFIKIEFALRDREHTLDVVLLEEPENHLSYVHTRKLINRISHATKKQIFVATHSSMICTRLNLRKAIILSETDPGSPTSLKGLPADTASFFMKAPDNNVLELALCKRAILVEGDAEFIMMETLYNKHADGGSLDKDGVHVISVDGTSFKRYFDLAKILRIRVAAIRDNDGAYQKTCVDNYANYNEPTIKIFSDPDDKRSTFEICMYEDNTAACEDLFAAGRKKLTVQQYMLDNKAEAAFQLLDKKADVLVAPAYIQEAVAWIKQ